VPGAAALECRGVGKRFYHYEHRTTTLQEFFVRSIMRQPIHVRRPHFQLTGLDLFVEAGEAVALIGSNGSGKSTALRLIAGIYPPTEGTIQRRGRVVAVIELGATFHPELTGVENAGLYAAALGLSRREITERYAAMLAFADIGDFLDVPIKYFSSGMRARLAFSVALWADADILLLDEVLAVGDEAFRERCLERLRTFHAGGGTILMVSHDLQAVRGLCSRALWLENGRVRESGAAGQVVDSYLASTGAPS
jgi:lipopolysaccharide transport system ATP-binding protein